MQKINFHYIAQLLDQSGMSYSLSRLENTITITVGDDEEHEYDVRISIDGDTVWLTSSSIRIKGATEAAYSQVMRALLTINMTLQNPARIGMHQDGEAMVMMAVPVLTQFGIGADSLKTFVLEFVVVVQEVIDLLEAMSAPKPSPWIAEHRSRCSPKFDVKQFCRLLEMRRQRLSLA
jgi:hypothetical protein